jgi:hypothetical protein
MLEVKTSSNFTRFNFFRNLYLHYYFSLVYQTILLQIVNITVFFSVHITHYCFDYNFVIQLRCYLFTNIFVDVIFLSECMI